MVSFSPYLVVLPLHVLQQLGSAGKALGLYRSLRALPDRFTFFKGETTVRGVTKHPGDGASAYGK